MLTDTSGYIPNEEALMCWRRNGIIGWTKSVLMLMSALACSIVAAPASAEWFTDLYIGGAFTEKHDVDTNFPTIGGQVTTLDVSFNNSFAGGFRGGYWFAGLLGPVTSASGWTFRTLRRMSADRRAP